MRLPQGVLYGAPGARTWSATRYSSRMLRRKSVDVMRKWESELQPGETHPLSIILREKRGARRKLVERGEVLGASPISMYGCGM